MLKVGLTGGLGSGKSTVSSIFAKLGSYIFDADAEGKKILEENEQVQNDIIEEFGSDVLNPSGTINNKKLARVAFQDEDHQILLNTIVHPYVFEELDKRYQKISTQKKYKNFIVDGALVFESGLDQHLDFVILVASLLKYRIGRALERGNLAREDFLNRIDLQWTDEQKSELADYVIYNNGTVKELEEKVKIFFKEHL